jgi:hypothetical protein
VTACAILNQRPHIGWGLICNQTFFQQNNFIHSLENVLPVRNNKSRASDHQTFQCLLNYRFAAPSTASAR